MAPYFECIVILQNFSSNVNKVIRAVLNSFFFFFEKILHAPKAPKVPKAQRRNEAKAQNANKQISAFFPLGVF